MKKDNGVLKANKFYKAGIITALAGLGVATFGGLGMLGASFAAMTYDTYKDLSLKEVAQTAEYQEYFLSEKDKLDDSLKAGEISATDYKNMYENLVNGSKEEYVLTFGSAEQKEEIEMLNGKIETSRKAEKGFGLAAVPGLAAAFVGVTTTGKSLSYLKKREAEVGEADAADENGDRERE